MTDLRLVPVAKMDDTRKRQLTAAASGIGAAAGAAGLAYGAHDSRKAINAARVANGGKKLGFRRALKAVPLHTKAFIPLEVAGLAGEVSAAHILHGDTKKAKPGRSALHAGAGGSKGVSFRKRQQLVSKNMAYVETDLSWGRSAGAGLGGAALAYGIPRMRTTSNVVAYGLNNPSRNARTLASAAQRALASAEKTTAGLEPHAARLASRTHTGRALLALPRPWKAGAAAGVGAALLHHNLPIRQTSYRPVYGYPPVGGT